MALARLFLGLIVSFACILLLRDALQVRSFEAERASTVLPETMTNGPFDAYGALAAARHASREWRADPEKARQILENTVQQYPLDPVPWLALARIQSSSPHTSVSTVSPDLDAAVAVTTDNRPTLWTASQIAIQADDLVLAQAYLRRWVELDPRGVDQALVAARRWLRHPEELLSAVLPDSEAHLSQAMEFALIQRDPALADAVWQRVRPAATLDSADFLNYAESLLTRGETDALVRLWNKMDRYYRPGDIANGSFSRELGASRGLNWRTDNAPSGVRIQRDLDEYESAPASLRLEFLGTHNLRLASPRIQIPLENQGPHILTGRWRGRALTTRGRPYLQVEAAGARTRPTLSVPGPQFDWTTLELEFEVPQGSSRVQFSVRRDPVQAFDRDISGELWLDDLSIRPVPQSDDVEASPL